MDIMNELTDYKKSTVEQNSSFANQCPTLTHIPFLCYRPIGVFWDIENCCVPSGLSVIKLAENIRQFIIEKGFREREFLVVCDTKRFSDQLLLDLDLAQIKVQHCYSCSKNAADNKLIQEITRFIEIVGYDSCPAILVLTDDINFAGVLSDLRYRKGVYVILFQRQASPALLACAHFHIDFTEFCRKLPPRFEYKSGDSILLVVNLPIDRKRIEVKSRLLKLTANCGGKVFISPNCNKSEAIIKFGCFDDAKRALQRIDGQDVFGNKIVVKFVNTDSIESLKQNNSDSENSNSSDSSTHPIVMAKPRTRTHSTHSNTGHFIEMNELMPYCAIHSSPVSENAWTEYLNSSKPLLPMVNISLNLLSTRVHHLLDTHGGALPVNSFADCYIGEFHETFNTRSAPLVSLEHLITCVPGVCISISPTNYIKRLTWIQNSDKQYFESSINSEKTAPDMEQLANKMSHFGKEVRELLKSQPHSTIAFNKFVPAYHTHFVRQLCVSSFGFIKLSELLQEIPHIVEIYGENDGRMITLTHREQTKRFATDLIKVLKAQNGRKIKLSQFPSAYQLVFNKPFDIADYGVCFIEDILKDVWEGTIAIKPFGSNDKWLEMPKRERNSDQIKRTKHFGTEVVRLLSTISNFELTFSKFIPNYHHYYNKQCRVLDYGFTKLMDLLEELVPNYVEMEFEEEYGERVIKLNKEKRIKALGHRFELILKNFKSRSTSISNLTDLYRNKYSLSINYVDYDVNDFNDLIEKMPSNWFQITQTRSTVEISLIDKHYLRQVSQRVIRTLMEQSNAEMKLSQLEECYLKAYHKKLLPVIFNGEYKESFEVCQNSNSVKLSPIVQFARDCIQLMQTNSKEKFTLDDLETGLMDKFQRPLPQPYNYKCTSFSELFRKLNDYFIIEKKGKPGKFILLISLSESLRSNPIAVKTPKIQILKRIVKPKCDLLTNSDSIVVTVDQDLERDLLSGYIPVEIPLPKLIPSNNVERDLICWSPEASDSTDSGRNSPNLMDFRDIADNGTGEVCPQLISTDSKSGPKVNGFGGTNGFCKKTRIIANLS